MIIVTINDNFIESVDTAKKVVAILSKKSPNCKLIWFTFSEKVGDTLRDSFLPDHQPVLIDSLEELQPYLKGSRKVGCY